MLVVGHQHQGVAGVLHRLQRPVVVVERRRHPDFAAQRGQRRLHLGDEGWIARERGGRDVLDVEDVAGIVLLLGLSDQGGDQLVLGGGVAQQSIGDAGVERALRIVVHHRQHRRRMGRRADHRHRLGIVGDVDVAGGVLHRDPLRRDHVQIVDVLGQRSARFGVPGDVEADGQRLDRGVGAGRLGPADMLPARPALQMFGVLDVQSLQRARVAQLDVRQVRGQRQRGQEAGDDGRQQGQHEAASLPRPPGAAAGRVMEDKGFVRRRIRRRWHGGWSIRSRAQSSASPSA